MSGSLLLCRLMIVGSGYRSPVEVGSAAGGEGAQTYRSGAFERRALLAVLGITGLVYALYLVRFAAASPGEDFMGDVVYVEKLAASLREGRIFHDWIAEEALGRPSTVQRGSALLFFAPACLTLLGLPTVAAAKFVFALLHTTSFASLYSLARKLSLARWASVLGASAYLLCPLHLDSFFRAGHWQLAFSYGLSPLLASLVFSLARGAPTRTVALFALSFSALLLSDNERTVTLLPLLAAFALLGFLESRADGTSRARRLFALLSALLLGIALSLAGTGPLLLARHTLALASDRELFSIHQAPFVHPLYFLDHGNLLYAWGDRPPPQAVGFHGGWLLSLGSLLVAPLVASRALAPPGERRLLRVLLLALVGIYWLAASSPAWSVSSPMLFFGAPALSWTVTALLAIAYGTCAFVLTRKESPRIRSLLLVGLLALPFVSATTILAPLPIVGAIKNLRWFAQVNQPLAASLVVALGASWLSAQGALARRTAVMSLVGFFVVDHTLNRPNQSEWSEPRPIAADILSRDPIAGRYLHYPYVESDWHESLFARETKRSNAGSWLLWAATKGAVHRFADLHRSLRQLEDGDDRAMTSAVDAALTLDVRYLVVRGAARFDRAVAKGYLEDRGGGVYRIAAHRTSSLFSWGGVPLGYDRPTSERIVVPRAPRGHVTIAEAAHPGWAASLDGTPLELSREDGTMAVDLQRAGELVLTFSPPPSDRWFRLISLLALLGTLTLLAAPWVTERARR